jgi:hypothetical protein
MWRLCGPDPCQQYEVLTLDHPRFVDFHNSLPVLVVEWSKEGVKAPAFINDAEKICPKRWKSLQKIAFIPLGGIRLYAIQSLHNTLHYEIPFSQVAQAIGVAQKLVEGGQELIIILLDERDTFQDNDLVCRYNLRLDEIQPICWEHLNLQLLKNGTRDSRRNVLSRDYGFCGWKNAAREKNLSGLAHPRTHSGTDAPCVKETFKVLSQIIALELPKVGKEIYNSQKRNVFFAGTLGEGNNVETFRHVAAIVSQGGKPLLSNFLSGHCDSQNEKEDDSFMWVCSVSISLYSPSHNTVSAQKIITYGKAAAGQFVTMHHKYANHLINLKQFWDGMDSNLKTVSRELAGDFGISNWTILPSTHSMKSVLYSVHAVAICAVVTHFSFMLKNPWYIMGLLFCVITSNCPQHFFNECKTLISDPILLGSTPVSQMSPLEFANKFYHHLFHARITSTYLAVPHRQPPCHQLGTELQVNNSIHSIGRMVLESRKVPSHQMKKNIRFYYQRCVANLCQDCPLEAVVPTGPSCKSGVYGADSTTVEEIIGVAAVLGVLPFPFTTTGDVRQSSTTFRYLVDKLENTPFTDANHLESITNWLKAVSHLLGITIMQAQEVTNKWVLRLMGANSCYKDSIPPGTDIFYPNVKSGQLICLKPDESKRPATFLKFSYDFEGGWGPGGQQDFVGNELYWEGKFKDGTRFCSKKSCRTTSKEPSMSDYFPLEPPEGFSVSAAKATGKMRLPTLSPQAVIESMNPPLPGHKQNIMDPVGALSVAKYGRKDVTHKQLFCIVKKRFHNHQTRRKTGEVSQYYCAGISLKGGKFDELGLSNQETFFPPKGFLLCRDELGSISMEEKRWFRDLDEAKDFACLSLIFDRPYLFASVSSLWDNLLVSNLPPQNMMEMYPEEESTDSVATFNVMSRPRSRKKPVPYMVCVRYSKGGLAYYLVDSHGKMDSQLLVCLPPNVATRIHPLSRKEEKVQFIDIADHSMSGKEILLLIVWKDEIITKEPMSKFAKENFYSVYCYATKKKLNKEIGWRKYCKCQRGKTVSVTPKDVCADYSSRPKRQRISDDQKTGVKN